MPVYDRDRDMLKAQLEALQLWIADLQLENRGLRRAVEDCRAGAQASAGRRSASAQPVPDTLQQPARRRPSGLPDATPSR